MAKFDLCYGDHFIDCIHVEPHASDYQICEHKFSSSPWRLFSSRRI